MSVRERDASGQHMTGGITYTYLGDGAAVVNLSAPQSASTGAFILEQNGYHPFGTKIDLGCNLSTNRWRYAGKEEQDIAGMDLRLLDFGARFYDPYILRWNAVDPLAHKYFDMSPYNYCGNDPVNKVDPDGRDWRDINGNIINDHSRILIYIFYDPNSFSSQSKKMYTDAVTEYGDGSVAMSSVTTEEEFSKDWRDMKSNNIKEVDLNYHGNNQTVKRSIR